ncbi:MAG: S8 family serine peptidase, partial [Clostridia bacterium]|nr:S8 family serine peptidase [Clostridia bacterium]
MKKIICLILSFILLLSAINISVFATENTMQTEDVEDFCEGLTEMVNDYADSGFVTPDSSVIEETTAELGEETEINFCSRLIVQSDNKINTYNAIDVVSGFSNFYILQFKNEEDTNYAYEQYKADENIISVSYDVFYKAMQSILDDHKPPILTYEEYKNAWYLNNTGMDLVLNEYSNKNLPEVVIAVLDTGFDLNSQYLQDRIIRTYYNGSGEGDENVEQDYFDHGTKVASVIANSTPDNVKIANYKIGTSEGKTSAVSVATAILQAIADDIKIINCSFSLYSDQALLEEAIDFAYENNCFVFVSSPNQAGNISICNSNVMLRSGKTITVSSSNIKHEPSCSTRGKFIDVLAPGEDMEVIALNNNITTAQGSSFSTSFMASVAAIHCSVYPHLSFSERFRMLKNSGDEINRDYSTNYYGSGIVNALKLFKLDTVQNPIFSTTEEKVVGKVVLEIYAEEGADIYYTTDCTYPSKNNGNLYKEPIEIYDESVKFTAVAYKDGRRSNYVFQNVCSFVEGTNEMFEINEYGVVTKYSGNVKYLKIPEVIKGITVKEISYFSGFDTAEILGVILPDTVKYFGCTDLDDGSNKYNRPILGDEQIGAFTGSETLEFIAGKGIKVIGYYGVANT